MSMILRKPIDKVPEPTLRRLPWYLSSVKLMKGEGEKYVSSTQISKLTNIDAAQIAKDLSYVNISGRTRVGYDVGALIDALERFLGFTSSHQAYLFGVGSLGGALLQDSGLNHYGLKIVGAFDINAAIIDKVIGSVPVYHVNRLEALMKQTNVRIGILTVPITSAQKVTDRMVASGIRAIWNFTPFRIHVPEGIVVQNTSIYAHLALMFNRLNDNQKLL